MGLRAKGFRALGLRFSLGFMAQGLGSRGGGQLWA